MEAIMRQTVVGVYDGYADACSAQRALTEAGISQADISIYATSPSTSSTGGPRVYAPGGVDVRRERPVFDQLEQLFSRLFERGAYPPETEDYREVIRRGGAIVSVDTSEVQTDLACDVMRRTGAADIEERAKAWHARADEASARARESAMGSEEPPMTSAQQQSRAQEQPMPTTGAASVTQTDTLARAPSASVGGPATTSSTAAPGSALQAGATSTPLGSQLGGQLEGYTEATRVESAQRGLSSGIPGDASEIADGASAHAPLGSGANLSSSDNEQRDDAADASTPVQATGTGYAGDPGMDALADDSSYDEEFRRDYDSRYANTNAPYDDYHRAYTHGATFANDERYRGREWPDVEASAREHWESRYPESTWERFKAAVRHGWERVTEKR
jgi:hypothetical protein